MTVDPTIAAAIAFLAAHLPEVAKGATEAVAKESTEAAFRLLGWMRGKLTGRGKQALNDLESDPGTELNQQVLAAHLADLVKQQPALLAELRALVPAGSVQQSQTLAAGAAGNQVVGQGNTVTISR